MVDADIAARYPLLAARAGAVRACRVCGCTADNACTHDQLGPCWWVEDDLCSHCGEPMIVVMEYEKLVGSVADRQALTVAELNQMLQWSAKAYAALQRAIGSDPATFEPGTPEPA